MWAAISSRLESPIRKKKNKRGMKNRCVPVYHISATYLTQLSGSEEFQLHIPATMKLPAATPSPQWTVCL